MKSFKIIENKMKDNEFETTSYLRERIINNKQKIELNNEENEIDPNESDYDVSQEYTLHECSKLNNRKEFRQFLELDLLHNKDKNNIQNDTEIQENELFVEHIMYYLNLRDGTDCTPFHLSIIHGSYDIFKSILEFYNIKNIPLILLFKKKCNNTPIFHLLFRIGSIDTNKHFIFQCLETLFYYICIYKEKNNMNTILNDLLCEKDEYETNILHVLSSSNLIQCYEYLYNYNDNLQIKSILENLSKETDDFGYFPIHYAVKHHSKEMIVPLFQLNNESLLYRTKDIFYYTPAHICLHYNNVKGLHMIIQISKDSDHLKKDILMAKQYDGKTISDVAKIYKNPIFSKIVDNKTLELDVVHSKNDFNKYKNKLGIFYHDDCYDHLPELTYSNYNNYNSTSNINLVVPPENAERLDILLNKKYGILHSNEINQKNISFFNNSSHAPLADILRVHDYNYVMKIKNICERLEKEKKIKKGQDVFYLDPDTGISSGSYDAACRATGSVLAAVDWVVSSNNSAQTNEARNSTRNTNHAFVVIRPPGHHAGLAGIAYCEDHEDSYCNDSQMNNSGSHGFCLLNNVAVGAAYARYKYSSLTRNLNDQKNSSDKCSARIAIVDFDVHHGNGTEEIIHFLKPRVEKKKFSIGNEGSSGNVHLEGFLSVDKCKIWFDEKDHENVFFTSVHGYGQRQNDLDDVDMEEDEVIDNGASFYPGSGKTNTILIDNLSSDSTNQAYEKTNQMNNDKINEEQKDEDLTSVHKTSEHSKKNDTCIKNTIENDQMIINIGLLYERNKTKSRQNWRNVFTSILFPRLVEFKPDFLFISAGFDGHRKEAINSHYLQLECIDYEWVTSNLTKIANYNKNTKIISVLEGGYNLEGKTISPFARSVAAHVRALSTNNQQIYDTMKDDDILLNKINQELFILEKKKNKKIKEKENLNILAAARSLNNINKIMDTDMESCDTKDTINISIDPTKNEIRTGKRKRTIVDYIKLKEKLDKEEVM